MPTHQLRVSPFNYIDFIINILSAGTSFQHPFIHITSSCDSSKPLVSAVRMSSASCVAVMDAVCRETMLEEEGQLARLHPRAAVRSLNGKGLNLTGVIWTVRFWSTSSTPAAPDPNFPNPKPPWTTNFFILCKYMIYCTVLFYEWRCCSALVIPLTL